MKEIRVGIIGTGIIAHVHLRQYAQIPGVRVVAACDILEDKCRRFCDQHGIENRYADYRELLKRDDLDAVDVCLHNNLHAPISIQVMESGKDCYCEKPVAGSYADALAMERASKATGKRLHIQLGTLYTPECRAAKRIVDSGFLGGVYHARCTSYRRRNRPFVDGYGEKEFVSRDWAAHGALYDAGVYQIGMLLYLLGIPALDRVSGSLYQRLDMDEGRRRESGYGVEEYGVGFAKFAGGLTMDLEASWAIHNGTFPFSSLAGDKGGLRFACSTLDKVPTGEETLELYTDIAGYPADLTVRLGPEEYRMHQLHPECALYDNSVAHWVGVLRGQCEPLPTLALTMLTEQISDGVYLSSVQGREITADEVAALSVSTAMREQETPFGTLKYNISDYLR